MPELENLNDYELFLGMLGMIAPVSGALEARFKQCIKREKVSRKQFLLRPGEVSRRIYFIVSGLCRAYFVDADGRQKTTWFMGTGDVMISVYSFYTREPASEYIETLEDSVLFYLTWRQVQDIYKDFPEFNLTGRLLTENYYVRSEARTLLLRLKRPEERYQAFLANYSNLAPKLPQQLIASFLELTPETLSRTRAKLISIKPPVKNSPPFQP
jgi:CRP-like cAMP-binding protein